MRKDANTPCYESILRPDNFAAPHDCGWGASLCRILIHGIGGNVFGLLSCKPEGMRSMEIHLGVIRDRPGIYSALLESQSTKRQLAVCFNSNGKLLVKICTVSNIEHLENAGVNVTLTSNLDVEDNELTIELDHIQSIYPIRDFLP